MILEVGGKKYLEAVLINLGFSGFTSSSYLL